MNRNKKRRPKAKGQNNAFNNMRERDRDERREPKADNDVSWYTRYPELSVAAASFPYPYRPGMTLPLGSISGVQYNGQTFTGNMSSKIPGVLAMEWLPSLGYSQTATDPASVMAKEVYGKVRKAFSGALNADAPDFVMYLLSLDGIFSYIGALKRIYRVLTAWSPDNYVLPDTLLSAMGIVESEVQSLRSDKTRLWQCINTLVLQSRKFTCPAVMDYFNRHYWMNDNVYTDAASINSQFYVFVMNGVYKFGELAMPNGDMAGGLVMTPTPWNWDMRKNNTTQYVTVDTLYNFGLELINALVAWDEAYEINGYLSRAFEGSPNFIVDELPIDQPFNPVYSEEVLVQIENSRTAPAAEKFLMQNAANYAGFNITQDVLTNAVLCDPHFTAVYDSYYEVSGQGYSIPPVLSARMDQPTVANNIIASRLQTVVRSVDGAAGNVVHLQCASECALCWKMYRKQASFTEPAQPVAQQPVALTTITTASGTTTRKDNGVAANTSYFNDLAAFDWHPFVYFVRATVNVNNGTAAPAVINVQIVGDHHNVTTITLNDLVNLHTICLYSELNSFSVN